MSLSYLCVLFCFFPVNCSCIVLLTIVSKWLHFPLYLSFCFMPLFILAFVLLCICTILYSCSCTLMYPPFFFSSYFKLMIVFFYLCPFFCIMHSCPFCIYENFMHMTLSFFFKFFLGLFCLSPLSAIHTSALPFCLLYSCMSIVLVLFFCSSYLWFCPF